MTLCQRLVGPIYKIIESYRPYHYGSVKQVVNYSIGQLTQNISGLFWIKIFNFSVTFDAEDLAGQPSQNLIRPLS